LKISNIDENLSLTPTSNKRLFKLKKTEFIPKKMKKIWLSIFFIFLGMTVYYFYPENKLPTDIQINKLVVYKSNGELLAYSNGQLVKTYKISIGRQPFGKKEFKGDEKTPEGIYQINNKNAKSDYHKNLGISYPNKADIKNAKRLGKQTGGDIKIHGIKNKMGFIGKFHRWFNWTQGCIAVTDDEIDELYNSVKIGTKIDIKP
jgi:murein L,D-transpeptidase YafK